MNLKIQNDSISSLSQRYTTTYAIKKGYFNLIRCLLCLGADPNYVDEKENLNRTSLIYNTFIKDDRWAQNVAYTLLEHGADLSKSDSRGLNPIHYCCTFGRDKLLEVFLKSVDFDLSRSLDLNGNTCMHYAIRSGNIRCINLLINKFVTSNFAKKINLKNRFGLSPIDVQTEEDIDEIEECKKPLIDYINLTNSKKIQDYKAKLEIEAALKEKSKVKKKKTKKSKKIISKPETQTETNKIDEIFKTQINESQFLNSVEKNSLRFTPKLVSNSNFNHFTGKIKAKHKNDLFGKLDIPKIVINAIESEKSDEEKESLCDALNSFSLKNNDQTFDLKLESVEKLEKNDSLKLSLKSLLLTYKDFLANLIEYNDLFFAKEHMLKDGLQNKLSRVERSKSQQNRPQEKNKPQNWKESLPSVFSVYEDELTVSFRHSIRPPVLKKVKSNQKYYDDLKTKAKQVALARKKKSKIIIVRNSLFNKLSSGSQFSISPESYTESSVFEEDGSILPSNGRTSTLSIIRKRKESLF